ncbi:hypothetical protein [Mesorhizobium sp. WSM2239]|uniref:Antitoxin n=2 Tax=unclassified Mesorhizobium TaxID=325217 RepID=A0AAU8D6J8_9HYPH
MSSNLPLAVDIADTVARAKEKHSPVDVHAKAKELHEAYPDADATHSDIAEVLLDETKDAGVQEGDGRPGRK